MYFIYYCMYMYIYTYIHVYTTNVRVRSMHACRKYVHTGCVAMLILFLSLPTQSSEHADHEFTQLVVLVSLIREHLQKKQLEHIHPTLAPSSPGTPIAGSNQQLKPPRLSKLERAKLALTNSFDNLRKGSKTSEKQQRQLGRSLTTDDTSSSFSSSVTPLATENRRASLDPKVLAQKRARAAGRKTGLERSSSARVPVTAGVVREGGDSSGGEEVIKGGGGGGGGGGRTRAGSWLQRLRSSKPPSQSSQEDLSDGELQRTVTEEQEKETSPLTSSSPLMKERKNIKPAQKLERYESKEDLPEQPLTQPLSPVPHTPPRPPTPPSAPATNFKTPPHTPVWRKPADRRFQRAHTKTSFTPPPAEGTTQAYSKYKRGHKRLMFYNSACMMCSACAQCTYIVHVYNVHVP